MSKKSNTKNAVITKTVNKKQMAIDEKNRQIKITKLLGALKVATQRHEKCRLRNQLRKLNHFGGLRNRTYLNKSTNETIIVEKKSVA